MNSLYQVEEIKKVEGDGFYFSVIKSTETLTGKVTYRAIPHDDCGDVLTGFPIRCSDNLVSIVNYAESQI